MESTYRQGLNQPQHLTGGSPICPPKAIEVPRIPQAQSCQDELVECLLKGTFELERRLQPVLRPEACNQTDRNKERPASTLLERIEASNHALRYIKEKLGDLCQRLDL